MKSALLAGVLVLIAVTVNARVNHQSMLDTRYAEIEAQKTQDDELLLEKIEIEIAKARRNGQLKHAVVKSDRHRDLTAAQKQRIVDMHNEYRRQEGATDMAIIEYDNNLERLAKDWVERCSYGHRPGNTYNAEEYGFDRVGESIWAWSAGAETVPDSAVKMWYDEKKDYTYGSAACSSVCGHYTAVVWANTSRIGCAHASCSSLANTGIAPADYVVCNYGRGQGMYQQDKPYEKGDACTGCQTGVMKCNKGLCDHACSSCECKANCKCGEKTSDCGCKCNKGWVGPLCKDQCSDLSSMCGQNPGYPDFFCNPLPGMEALVHDTNENCPKLCGLCKVGDGSCNKSDKGKLHELEEDLERRSELEEEVEKLSDAEVDLLVAALQKRADQY